MFTLVYDECFLVDGVGPEGGAVSPRAEKDGCSSRTPEHGREDADNGRRVPGRDNRRRSLLSPLRERGSMKASKLRRKRINRTAVAPRPPRKHKIAPTYGDAAAKQILVGQCSRKVAEGEIIETKLKFLKKTKTVDVPCGGKVYVKRGNLGKRRVYCESCKLRNSQRKQATRFQKRLNRISPRAQVAEQRKEVSRLRRLTRRGG